MSVQAPARRRRRHASATPASSSLRRASPPALAPSPTVVLETGHLALAVVVPLVFSFQLSDAFELPKQIALRVLLAATILAAGAVWIAGPQSRVAGRDLARRALRWPPLWVAAAVGGAWTVATLFSIAPAVSFWGIRPRWTGLQTQLAYMALFLASAAALARSRREARFARVVAAVGATASLYGIAQRLSLFSDFVPLTEGSRPHSTFGNPIFFADYLTLALFVTLGGALAGTGLNRRLMLASTALQGLALVITETRGALVGAASGAVVLAVLLAADHGRAWRRWLAAAAAAGVLALAGLWLGQGILLRYPTTARLAQIVNPSAGTGAIRLVLWRTSLRLWMDRPLTGWGPDTYGAAIVRRLPAGLQFGQESLDEAYDRPHSATFEVLSSEGGVGAAALLFAGAVAACSVRALLRRDHGTTADPRARQAGRQGRTLAAGLAAGLVAYLVAQQTSIESAAASALAWTVAGAIVGGGAAERRRAAEKNLVNPEATQRLNRGAESGWLGRAALAGGAALALWAAFVWWESGELSANAAFKRGYDDAGARRAADAVAQYELAVVAWPNEYRYWLELAYSRAAIARNSTDRRVRTATYQQALAAIDRSLALYAGHPQVQASWGEIAGEVAADAGDQALGQRAVDAHAQAVKVAPERWRYYTLAGTTELRLGRIDDGRRDLQRAVQLQDSDWLTWSRIGDAEAALGNRTAAGDAYTKSLQLNPQRDDVRRALDALGPR